MVIERVEIKDFLVFKGDFTANFCPGVNVFIGGNGTGKTTLMKVLYWGCEFSNKSVLESNGNLQLNRYENSPFNTIFLLYNYFNITAVEEESENDIVSNIKLYGYETGNEHPALDVGVSKKLGLIQMRNIGIEFPQTHTFLQWCKLKVQSVYIPMTEMLSHSRGFLALNRERPVPFDCTEIDIIAKAELEPTREVTENAKKTIDIVSKVIEGKVAYDGKDFYIEHVNGISIPFSFEASGFRKFGLLWKLLRNGLLEKGSVLFWDEPENSLNPELVPVLVDILLELSRNGVQIFVATHSEIFASYFSVNKQKGDNVMFQSLYKVEEQIKADSNDRFELLNPNKLTEEPVKLYEKKLNRELSDD